MQVLEDCNQSSYKRLKGNGKIVAKFLECPILGAITMKTYKCLFSKYGHPLMTFPNQLQQSCILLPRLLFTKIAFNTIQIFKDSPHPITHEDAVTIRPASICPTELFTLNWDHLPDFASPAKRTVTGSYPNNKIEQQHIHITSL